MLICTKVKKLLVSFNGVESHSSLIENGVNSIDYCGEFINFLKDLQKDLIKTKNNKKFNPPYPTINIGKIQGGIAVNIIPKECELEFEIRDTPNLNTEKTIKKIKDFLKRIEKKMKAKNESCSVVFKMLNNFPPLETNEKKIINLVLDKLKSNSVNSVSFGTEAGVFNKVGFETIVCGPGSIEQAHKPNEYVEEKQLKKCDEFLTKIIDFYIRMKLEQLDYHIPKNLIATEPTKPRDESSLVVVNKEFEVIKFKEILNELRKGDTLVFNNTKVINAHLDGRIKKRKVSVNLNKIIDKQKTIWSAFLKSNKKPLINEEIIFPFELKAKIIDIIKNNNTDFFFKYNLVVTMKS